MKKGKCRLRLIILRVSSSERWSILSRYCEQPHDQGGTNQRVTYDFGSKTGSPALLMRRVILRCSYHFAIIPKSWSGSEASAMKHSISPPSLLCNAWIFSITFFTFSSFRPWRIRLNPLEYKSFVRLLPIPSVDPVTTAYGNGL